VVYPGGPLSLAGLPSPQMPSEHSSMSSSPEPNAATAALHHHHHHGGGAGGGAYLPGLKVAVAVAAVGVGAGQEEGPRVKQEELRPDESNNGDAYEDFDYEDEDADYASDSENHINQ